MKVDLTKKQYESLVMAITAGSSVYGILADNVSDSYQKQYKQLDDLADYFLSLADEFGASEFTEEFMGSLIMNDKLAAKLHQAIEDYNDDVFWYELEVRLGKRDFGRTMTAAERAEIIKGKGWLPERIRSIYEKWGQEFEKHGIERLEIVSNRDK